MRVNLISIIVFLCATISATLALYAWRRRTTHGSLMFSYLMTSITLYVLGYSLELASLNLPTMLLWSKIEYIGISTFPGLFLLFVLQYTCRDNWITRRNILILFFIPALLVVAKFTDDFTHLVYSTTWLDTTGMIPLLGFTRGPIYIFALYSAIPVSLGIYLLWQKRQNTPPLYQNQATWIVASASAPVLVFILYMSGLQPFPTLKYLDLNAFMYPLAGVGVGMAMFRYRLFEITPIARNMVIERMSEGVLVLDDQARLVDANPMALKLLGWDHLAIGQSAQQVFSDWKDLQDACLTANIAEPVKVESQHNSRDGNGFFNITISSLQEEKGRDIGRLIVIHDITESKRIQEEDARSLHLAEALQAIGMAVSSSLDFRQVLDQVLENIGKVIHYDIASVLMREGDEAVIVSVLHFDEPDAVIGMRFSLDKESPNCLVVQQRKPVIVNDVQASYPSFARPEFYGTRSWLGIPLFSKDEIIGFLNLDSRTPGFFTTDDERIASIFASQVGTAIENARLYTESQRRLREQSILNEIIQGISSTLDMDKLISLVYLQVSRFISATYFFISQYDPDSQDMQTVYIHLDTMESMTIHHPTELGFAGQVIENHKPLFLANANSISNFTHETGRESLFPKPLSVMMVPLGLQENNGGVLGAENDELENAYSVQDFTLFSSIGTQIAVAFENARLFAQMEKLAVTDSLTGLNNRRHFFRLGQSEVERARRYHRSLAAIMLDIDHFKRVNDTFGHLAGDIALQVVAQCCRSATRKSDLIGRYGGEEFAILLPETNLTEAIQVAERLRQIIEEKSIEYKGNSINITASLGVAYLDGHGDTLDNLLDRSDQNMYEAKQAGRNQVYGCLISE